MLFYLEFTSFNVWEVYTNLPVTERKYQKLTSGPLVMVKL